MARRPHRAHVRARRGRGRRRRMGRGPEGPARRPGPTAGRNHGPARAPATGRHHHRARGGAPDRPSRPRRREGGPVARARGIGFEAAGQRRPQGRRVTRSRRPRPVRDRRHRRRRHRRVGDALPDQPLHLDRRRHGRDPAEHRRRAGARAAAGAARRRGRSFRGSAAYCAARRAMSAPDPAAVLHELTQHGSPTDRSLLVDFQPLDPSNRPAPFKRYVGLETTPLPTGFGESGARAADVLSGQGRQSAAVGLDAATLARLLFFTAGVTRTSASPVFEEPTYFRTAMSAGNLHPVEVYAVSAGVDGVADGVHHFSPLEHGLTTLRSGRAAPGPACSLVLTGIPWRTAWKYGERAFRHLYWDAGTMLANLLAMADACGLDARVWTGFVDHDMARLVGVDGVTEFPLALVSIGAGGEIDAPADLPPIDVDVERISPHPIDFPLITQAQQAGALADAAAVAEWRAHAAAGSPTRARVDPPRDATEDSIEQVILRRGSTRIMR